MVVSIQTTVAITGWKGRLGSALINRGCVPLACDITSKASIYAALDAVNPDIVIHCAAMTDVDACEKEKDKALEINVQGTENLKVCYSGKIIYISTDYVFDGTAGAYSENCKPADDVTKLCYYGYTKLLGEQLIGNGDTIIRTTMLYGSMNRMDFVTNILSRLDIEEPFEVTRALFGTPTYVPHLADAIMMLLDIHPMPNIINIAGRDLINRYEFALMIASFWGHEDKKNLIIPTLRIGKTKRPRKAGLITWRARKLGLPIHTVLEGLTEFRESNRRYYEDLRSTSN